MAGLVRARPPVPKPRWRAVARAVAVLAVLACGSALTCAPAHAQQVFSFPPSPPKKPKSAIALEREKPGTQQQMLVKADEIDYDYANHRVAAVGNVQIYYRNATIEADRVVYDQTNKRLHAEGNVRLTDADGKITYGSIMDLSDDYRDGFVDSLRLDSPDQTRMAAARAERSNGNTTVFHSGVYTACAPCKDDPKKPPLWQVKAARIIHDQAEKMIYFEDARLEFFGKPIAFLPYFSAPDPTVKRKTGVLAPIITSSTIYGQALEVPYYWALAPDYDATFSPMITTKQGPLLQGEFRQRLLNGAYSIRGAGIYQLDRGYFSNNNGVPAPGDRNFRGSVESEGKFAINDKWVWGWDGVLLTDKTFLSDYNPRLSSYHYTDTLGAAANSGISQLYLAGKGDRSYFDIRSIYYYGFSTADVQKEIPVIHPVIDYDYTFNHPVIGGELGYNINFTSLTRSQAEFDAVNRTALNVGSCAQTADTSIINSSNCLLRGIPGTYSRFSADTHWRRSFTDSFGQVFTPFMSLRADAASMQIDNDPGVSNYINTGDSNLTRATPTVGLEYRYPFINVQSWGTQTFEPIAQVIARPSEPQVGKWPNEDAQSLIFDDTNLFKIDKFSGYDRAEGGGRANYGMTYTAQFNQGGAFNALFGQSYSLWDNSFAQGGIANSGLDSGLDTTRSDYVARATFQPNATYKLSSRFRFDNDTFAVKRTELEAAANFDRWSVNVLYGDYAAQPDIGFLDRRQGLLTGGSVKLDANWLLRGSVTLDLESNKIAQDSIGVAYVNDCLILGLNYVASYSYGTGSPQLNNTLMLQLSLRTLGDTSVSQNVASSSNSH
jgi:LPS-assembly protein